MKNIIKKGLILSIVVLIIMSGVTSGITVNKHSNEIFDSNQKSSDGKLINSPSHFKNTYENQGSDNWTMLMHDLQHTGFSNCLAPENNIIKWSVDLDSLMYGSPAVVDNKIYVATRLNGVYCFDAENGNQIWLSETDEDHAWSSVAIYEDKLYVGGWSGLLFCLNLLNGEEIWNYSTGSRILNSPAVYNHRVYFGSHDHNIYCLNASDGKKIWNYTTDDGIPYSSPAIYDDKLYIGSNDNKVYCINASDGKKIWNFTTGGDIWSSPTVYDDKVFIGSNDNILYCLNAITGEKIWDKDGNSKLWSLGSIYNNSLYIGSGNKNFYRLNIDDGSEIWNFTADDGISGSPAIADEKVYFTCWGGYYYCLDADTGNQIWPSTRRQYCEYPVVNNGKAIFCEKYYGRIYCFGSTPKLEISDLKISNGKISANITNTGDLAAHNVNWELVVNKGIFKRMILKSNGSTAIINQGETITISADKNLSSLGRVYIKINVSSEDVNKDTIERYRGFAIGRKILFLENYNIKITKPERGLYILNKKILPRFFRPAKIIGTIEIEAVAIDDDTEIEKVEFYINGELMGEDTSEPYTYTWERDRLRLSHVFVIKVVSYEYSGDIGIERMIVRKFL